MAMLLHRVWGSVLARAAPGPVPGPAAPGSPRGRRAQPPAEQYCASLSLGALDAVPTDVVAQILRLLGPVEAARSTAVCRAWRILASDNGLWAFFLRLGPEPWDLVVFAETHLAAGPDSHPWSVPPRHSLLLTELNYDLRSTSVSQLTSLCISRLYFDNTPQLSFKQIYGLRAVVPGTLIVDGKT